MAARSDDTNRRRSTAQLTRTERETRTIDLGGPTPKRIFDQASIVALVLDTSLRVVRYNAAAERFFGQAFGGVLNRPYDETLPVLTEVNRDHVFQRTIALGVPTVVHEVSIRQPKSGKAHYFDFTVDPVLDDNGRMAGIAIFGLDVTDRAVLRRQITEQNEDLKSLQQVSEWLRRTLDLEKAFFIVATALTSAQSGYRHAMIFTVDQDREFLVGRICVDSLNLPDVWAIWRELTRHDAPLQKSLEMLQPVLARRWREINDAVRSVKIPLGDDESVLVHALRTQSTVTHHTLAEKPGLRVHPEIQRYFALKGFAAAPLMAEHEAIGVILVDTDSGPRDFTPEQLTMLEMFASQAALAINNGLMFQSVLDRAQRDSLTRLYNHGHFQETLRAELERASRYNTPLSLILLDIDHFKRFNDTWGHQVGDKVLKQTALLLGALVRVTDVAARYGGEEFALLLPQTDYSAALDLAERLRSGVERKVTVAGPGGEKIGVTASFGVASFPQHGSEAPALIAAADSALYRAKDRGRNCVVGASQPGKSKTEAAPSPPKRTKKVRRTRVIKVESVPVSPPPAKSKGKGR